MLDYFHHNGAVKASREENPAEYILETSRPKENGLDWGAIWTKSPEHQAMLNEIEAIATERAFIPDSREEIATVFAMPFIEQVKAVTQRVWRHYWRSPTYGYSMMFSNLSMALIGGVL